MGVEIEHEVIPGVSDHGALSGLGDDDHTQYALRSIMTTLGDIIYAAAAGVWTRLAGNVSPTRKFLRQVGSGAASAAPEWDTILDTDVVFSDVTTGDASTSKHGFLKKLDNDATHFLDGTGAWAI